jgi:hypothetical protein
MMEQRDLAILRDMRQEVSASTSASLGQVAERLLHMRDVLRFDDAEWYHDLTQHVATLDSASTFHPANEMERRQVDTAVQQAIQQIIRLIDIKLKP